MNQEPEQFPIWRALRRNSVGFIIFGIFTFFLTLLKFISPLYMLQIYNRVIPTQSQETLLTLSAIFGALLLLYGAIEFARTRTLNLFARYMDSELAGVSFSSVFRSHVTGQAPEGASRGSQGLSDLNTIRRFWSNGGVGSYFDAIFSPLMIASLYLINPMLCWLGVLGATVIFSMALLTEFASRSAMRASAEAEATSQRLSETSLQNAEVVNALGMLSRLKDRWLTIHDTATNVTSESGSLVGGFVATARTIRLLLQMAVLGLGAWLFVSTPDQMTAGGIVAASIILGQGLNPIDQSIQSWRQFVGARQASTRLGKLVASLPPEGINTKLPRPEAKLVSQGLNIIVPGQRRPLFTGINFSLNASDILVIIGASGKGKSSLLRILSGLWSSGGGSVTLGGIELTNWSSDDRGQYIGYLPQDVQLLTGTVRENISRLCEAEDEEIITAAKLAGCHDLILSLPMAYDTPLGGQHAAGTKAVNLSGGQRQRIGLARALFRNPPLILLDEPNSNLDDAGLVELSNCVKRLKENGHIIVLVTHSKPLIHLSNKLMVLRDHDVMFGPTQKVLNELTNQTQQAQQNGQNPQSMTTNTRPQTIQATATPQTAVPVPVPVPSTEFSPAASRLAVEDAELINPAEKTSPSNNVTAETPAAMPLGAVSQQNFKQAVETEVTYPISNRENEQYTASQHPMTARERRNAEKKSSEN